MSEIKITKLSKQINGRVLFTADQLLATDHDHIGIVGRNGAGKTTLAQLLLGHDPEYTGQLVVDTPITYVPQIAPTHDRSGGQAMLNRVRQALAQRPAILILDEPSANLDEPHQAWLQKQLKQYRGLLLLISHDRQLLNAVTTQTWAIRDHQLAVYPGNYAAYLAQVQQATATQQAAYERQNRHAHDLKLAMQARREKAQQVRKGAHLTPNERAKVKSVLETTAGKMEHSVRVLANRSAREQTAKPFTQHGFKLMATDFPAFNGKTIAAANNLTLREYDKTLLQQTTFQVKPGERLALVGPNGCGKTTLIKALLAGVPGLSVSPAAKIGVFNQDMTALDGTKTVWHLVRAASQLPDQTLRNVMGALGLPARFYDQRVRGLSGGELVKLQLVCILVGTYNVLILDEPTNYLDVDALDALADYLQAYPGTVIFVSHDEPFREQVMTRQLQFKNQRLIDPAQVATKASAPSDLPLLQFKYDQLMADPLAKTADIQALRAQIEALK